MYVLVPSCLAFTCSSTATSPPVMMLHSWFPSVRHSSTPPIGMCFPLDLSPMGFIYVGQPNAERFNLGSVGDLAPLPTTFMPLIITADNLIDKVAGFFGAAEGDFDFIPINSSNFFIAGVSFLILFWGFTYSYQRSSPTPKQQPTRSFSNTNSCFHAPIAVSCSTVFLRSWLSEHPWERFSATLRSPS